MGRERPRVMRKRHRIKVEVGSGNIFADLGLPDADSIPLG